MSDHFPNPRKGRNRMLAIGIVSMIPAILATVAIWVGIGMSYEDDAGVPDNILVTAFCLLLSLGIALWFLLEMWRKKPWARIAWTVLCGLWLLVFGGFGFVLLALGGTGAIPVFLVLLLLYGGTCLYLFRNAHVIAFFRKADEGMERKIEEMGS